LNVELELIEVADDGSDYESPLAGAANEGIGGFVMSDPGQFAADAALIASIAEKHGLCAAGSPWFARNGGLLGYGVNQEELFRRAAYFVDKILKGAKPGDIPIEQAANFHTVINLKAAKALGLDFPPDLLAAANEVIE